MEERATILRGMQICRFCLNEQGPFVNIYQQSTNDGQHSGTPLPLQIMACFAVEAFENDGMPQLICNPCKQQTIKAYEFKSTAKKSDDALKIFLSTGKLIKPMKTPIRGVKRTQANNHAPQKPAQGATYKRRRSNSQLQEQHVQEHEAEKEDDLHEQDKQQQEEDSDNRPKDIEYIDYIDTSQEQDQDYIETENDIFIEDDNEQSVSEKRIEQILKVPQVQTDVFPCSRCERTFPLKQLLDLHVKNHDRERCYACEICERKFFTKYDLAKHVQTHTQERPYTCVVCDKSFARETLLHRHEKIHADVPKYLCQECDKTFLTRDDLDVHVEKHKKRRPFSCRICDKTFVFKQGLERHEVSHSDEKPHKCNYCEASFTSPIKLTRHVTSHAGLRPYPCKLCGRTFLLSHHLTRHLRSHYANKSTSVEPVGQHKCDMCSMSFRRKDSLINHSAIHSMVNLKCVICNTEFPKAEDVKEHITTHLAGLPYPCDKCDYSFETQDHLEEHELKHAEMEYEDQIEQELSMEAKAELQEEYEMDSIEEEGDDDMPEYTITTDAEVVRRPKKVKNYAQFIKDQLGSDVENEIVLEEEECMVGGSMDEPPEIIKPIVRSEGTKMYTRKIINRKLPEIKSEHGKLTHDSINIENLGLTHEFVKDLPNEQYIDMKVGDVIYKVKKVTMKKTEFDAVAKQENVEIKGGLIVKKTIKGPSQMASARNRNITIDNILDQNKPSTTKPPITKTYVKKAPQPKIINADVEGLL